MKKLIIAIFITVAFGALLTLAMGEKPAEQVTPTQQTHVENVTISIEGMTCGGCSSSIQSKLKGMDGIIQSNVSHEAGVAYCTYDSTKLEVSDIKNVISGVGYKVLD